MNWWLVVLPCIQVGWSGEVPLADAGCQRYVWPVPAPTLSACHELGNDLAREHLFVPPHICLPRKPNYPTLRVAQS